LDGIDFTNLVGLVSRYCTKVWLTRLIAQGLVEAGDVDGAVKVVSAFPDAAWRLELLSELSLFLADTDDCKSALRVLMDVKDNDIVLDILLDTYCVDKGFEEALESFGINGERVGRAVKESGNCRLLNWLYFLAKAGRADEALKAAREFEESHYRSEGLMKVAVALAERGNERYKEVLNEALDAADGLCSADFDDVVASAVVELASVGRGELAHELAGNIVDDYVFVSALIDGLPCLEGTLLGNTVDEILEVADELYEEDYVEVLIKLFFAVLDLPELNKPLLDRIVKRVYFEPTRSLLQIGYASRLLENNDEGFKDLYREGMNNLRRLTGKQRFIIARALVPNMVQRFTADLIKFINEIPDVREQAYLLREISISKNVMGEYEDALKIARSINVQDERAAALYSIVDNLSEKDFERALNIANEIPDRNWRERGFSLLFANALSREEFREDLFKNVLAGLAKRDEGDALHILEPMVGSLAKKGRRELEDVVNLVSKLDYLKPLKRVLTFLVAGDAEGALKVAREESFGLAKILALSAIVVKTSHAKGSSPRKILDEARREVKKLENRYEQSFALTMIAFASAVTMQVKDAFEIIINEVPWEYHQPSLFEFLVRLPVAGRVDDLVKLVQNLDRQLGHPIILQTLAYTYIGGYMKELEKMLDPLISFDPFILSHAISFFAIRGEPELIQILIEKQKDDKSLSFSTSGLAYSLRGKAEQARRAFEKAFEELSKIPKDDTRRSYALHSIIMCMLASADESNVELGKKFLQGDELELLSEFFKASKHASEGRMKETQTILRSIEDKHPVLSTLPSMAIVAGRMKGKNSLTLLKDALEMKKAKELSTLELSAVFVQFIVAGGDPKIAVETIEKNWIECEDILFQTAAYFATMKNLEKFQSLTENMNPYNREAIIRRTAALMSYREPEEIAQLLKNLPVHTKDIILGRITEESLRRGRIEDALTTASKIVEKENYIHALSDMFLTLTEKLARE